MHLQQWLLGASALIASTVASPIDLDLFPRGDTLILATTTTPASSTSTSANTKRAPLGLSLPRNQRKPIVIPRGGDDKGSALKAAIDEAKKKKEEEEKKKKAEAQKTKYFHEPGGDYNLGHYDKRYFNGIVSYEERTDTQLHMIKAYLSWFKEQGLDTWIAHGTLLGWWWNGKRLPWDWDMDTQVSSATLTYLGKKHNQTIIPNGLDAAGRKRDYLLDVNPWIWQRERGNGMNIIDARWIDMRNGLFIDITGVAEIRPADRPGVWSCKNYHWYKVEDLFPMRETTFEGVPALVPYAYDKILVEEYGAKALVVGEYEKHIWHKELKEWVITPEGIAEEKKKEDERRKKKEEEERKKEEEERKKKEEALRKAQEMKE